MRKLLGASVAALMVVAPLLLILTGSAIAQTEGRPTLTDDGLYWADAQRVTTDPASDSDPQLVVDAKGDSHIIWTQANSFHYKKVDEQGAELIPQSVIATNANIPRQHSQQLCKAIGIDSKGDFHIIYQAGFGPVIYNKYNSKGQKLVPDLDTTAGLSKSTGANLAVARNDNAYVIYDYYPPGGNEREGLTMIDPTGKIIKQAVDVSEPSWYLEGATLTIDWEDNLRALMNVWYGADQGIHHSKLNKLGVRPANTPPVHLYATGGYSFPPMPPLAATPDGHVHLLISAAATGGGKMTYMELNEKGEPIEGLTSEIIITQNGADYGDVGADSRNNAYLFFTSNADGKLYYVKVEPGKENIQHQPTALTNGVGTARNPKVAVDPSDNLHVVWEDTRDGNEEIYYQFAINFGAEINMAPEEAAKLLYIRPEEHKTANLTIKNLGGLNDTVTVTLVTDFHGHEGDLWEAWIDEEVLELGPQEVYMLEINIRGPTGGNPGDFISVSLSASSAGNPFKNDTVTFDTYLVVEHLLSMTAADTIHVVQPGEETEYSIQITNDGDVAEDVGVSFEGPPDWDIAITDDSGADQTVLAGMLPSETRTATLHVTPPEGAFADEIGLVTVNGWLINYPTVKDTVVTHTIVAQSLNIQLDLEDSQHVVAPGEMTTYTITVTNTGNVPGKVLVILEIVSGSGDWTAQLGTSTASIGSDESIKVDLHVTAPDDGLTGQRLVTRVVGTNDARTQQDDVTATTIVGAVHEVTVTAAPVTKDANQGDLVVYGLSVSNNGNGDEVLGLTLEELPVGWSVTYAKDGAALSSVSLPPGGQTGFNAEVQVPADALAGTYAIKGKLTDSEGKTYSVTLTTVVLQVYGVDLTTTLSKQLGSPGRTVLFSTLVKNTGNGVDTFKLDVRESTLPPETKVEFHDADFAVSNELTLGPGQTGPMTVVVTLPGQLENKAEFEFSVQGKSQKGGKVDDVKFVIDAELPNLEVTQLVYQPDDFTANKAVTIEVGVVNHGNVDVENVTVRFYDGSAIVGADRLDRLPAESNKTVTFTWIPKNPSHTLKFWVDPDGRIPEVDESDNVKKDTIHVRGINGLTPGFEGVYALLALAMVGAAITRRRTKA